eukprot:3585329-Amphidinium_carterae.2
MDRDVQAITEGVNRIGLGSGYERRRGSASQITVATPQTTPAQTVKNNIQREAPATFVPGAHTKWRETSRNRP